MKLKIYILKKKQLYFTAIVLAIILVSIILIISIKTSSTLSRLTVPNSYKADINNDGKIDTVVVKTDSKTSSYILNVVCSDSKGYILEPDKVINTFGNISSANPLKITFEDIDGDKGDEIFVQGYDKKGSILNIYTYKQNQISRIASGRYLFYGVVKNNQDQLNTLVLGARQNKYIKLTYLDCSPSGLVAASLNTPPQLGVDQLNSVFSYIEQNDITSLSLNAAKGELSKLNRGRFIDGYLEKINYNSDNTPSNITYAVRVSSADEDTTKITNYKIELDVFKNSLMKEYYEIKHIEKR